MLISSFLGEQSDLRGLSLLAFPYSKGALNLTELSEDLEPEESKRLGIDNYEFNL